MASNNYIDQYTKVFLSCYTGSLYDECGNRWTSNGTLSIGYATPYSGAAANTTFPTAIYFGKGTAALASAINTTNKDVTIDFWYYRCDGHNSSQTKKLISFNEGRYFEFTSSPKTHNVWVNNGNRGTYLYMDYYSWYHIAYVFSKSENVWYIFLNGKKQDTITNIYNVTSIQPAINNSNVYIKNLRVSVGIARWTSNFTPNNKMYLPPPVEVNKIFSLARYLSGHVTAIFNPYRIPVFENINEYYTKRNIYKNYKYDTKRIVLVAPKLPIEYDLKRKILITGTSSNLNGLPLFNNDTKRKFLLSSTFEKPLLQNDTKRIVLLENNKTVPLLQNNTKRKVINSNIENEPLLQNNTRRKVVNSKNSNLPLQNNTKRKVINSNIENAPLQIDTKRIVLLGNNKTVPLLQNNTKRKVINSNIGNTPLQIDTKRIVLLGNNKAVPLLQNNTKRVLSSYFPLIKYNLRRIVSNNINIIAYTIKIEK